MADGITLNLTASVARFQSRLGGFVQRMTVEGGRAVQMQMHDVRAVIVATSPVDTGRFRSRWTPVTQQGDPLTWGTSNDSPYGTMLEYGGYRRAGPRTIALGGGDLGAGFTAGAGVYSRQAPLGFMRRALAQAEPQLLLRLQNVVRQAWGQAGGGASQFVPFLVGPAGPGTMAPINLTATQLGVLFGIDVI